MLAVLIVEQVFSMPAEGMPQCDPEYLQQVDSPKIRKICNFLQNYANAMQQYKEGLVVENPLGMMENGVKRQDVDHVFLRFGKRRR
jgi:hypothetical protein